MKKLTLTLASLGLVAASHAQLTLDTFVFDNSTFGNTLIESDGGSFSFSNWLNVVNTSPGNPGFLTGASFETGIANIGMTGQPTYTIGYDSPISNRPGDDLGIVVARYTEDEIVFAVSQNGQDFTGNRTFGSESAVDTGIHKLYYYGGGGPFDAELFVQPVDLSDFGIAEGSSIQAARITGGPQLDLIRVAGFAVPEPSAMVALAGLSLLVFRRRKGKD